MRIVQCWDDGDVSDIRLCDLLRRHRATATFNLNAGLHRSERYHHWTHQGTEVWKLAWPELPSVYQGFSIANHSLTHPRPTACDDPTLQREIVENRDRLEQHFAMSIHGFAYPFGDYDQRVKDAVRAAGHRYARTVFDGTVDPLGDTMEARVSRHVLSADFWEEYERVRARDGVFWFWGHSYEMIDDAGWTFVEERIARISADPRAQWCALADVFAPPGAVTAAR